jgi:hypothetical protein
MRQRQRQRQRSAMQGKIRDAAGNQRGMLCKEAATPYYFQPKVCRRMGASSDKDRH